ncbi:hypothetical protein ACHWQZ_G003818 [Mnemiopsis leidyi]
MTKFIYCLTILHVILSRAKSLLPFTSNEVPEKADKTQPILQRERRDDRKILSRQAERNEALSCRIVERNGFLKEVCEMKGHKGRHIFRCATSRDFYKITSHTHEYLPVVSGTCAEDDGFYQVCGLIETKKIKLGGSFTLCGGFPCTSLKAGGGLITSMKLISGDTINQQCNMVSRTICQNSVVDDDVCAENAAGDHDEQGKVVSMVSDYSTIEKSLVCNDRCDDLMCEDEANCNGFRYGMYCRNRFHPLQLYEYITTDGICDGYQVCLNGEDERNCSVPDNDLSFTCIHWHSRSRVSLRNSTRCFLYDHEREGFDYSYCTNQMDQTNCTDRARVGVTCKIRNFTSTVSKYMVCAHQTQLCDNGMENECVEVSIACTTHKHRLCDGITDCLDKSDEVSSLCADMTERTCVRTAHNDNKTRPIPIAWLRDGIEDCLDGKDEEQIWPTCGVGVTERYVGEVAQGSCENVFICPDRGFVQYKDLCDGYESCGIENGICKISRGSADYSTKELKSFSELGIVISSSFCLNGIENVRFLIDLRCQDTLFRFPDKDIFGVSTKNIVQVPSLQRNCDNLYGDAYVLTSCTMNCISTNCPLKIAPKYHSCPSQFKNRVGSLVGNTDLTFLTKLHGVYHNNYFVCIRTKECLEYSKVCDLVEDCGDGSDESDCTNHFKCGNTNHYLPKTSVCDGTIDCLDTSDECNEECSKRILNNNVLRVGAWLMSIFALIGNALVIWSEVKAILRSEKMTKLSNAYFIILIAVGDFITGIYLLWLAIVDAFVYGENYCKVQWTWLTSLNCSILGVLSTTGNLISLLAMATLSLLRASNIKSGLSRMRAPYRDVTAKGKCKALSLVMIVIFVSSIAAIVPLIPIWEDFFVNGMHYDSRMRLFIRFSNKEVHFNILQKYYGRMRKKTLSWKLINSMVDGMFSHDFEYDDLLELKKKQDFYGNDAVCLFKYFVRADDPQKIYTWAILWLNLLCFSAIAVSYGFIDFQTIKSANKVKNDSSFNRKIALIIATDFICWFPFIIICFLHSLQVMDGSKWYSFFSIVILPINSVINPILYSEGVSQSTMVCVRTVFGRCYPRRNNKGQPEVVNELSMTVRQTKSPDSETDIYSNISTTFYHDGLRTIGLDCVSSTEISVDLVTQETFKLSEIPKTDEVVDIMGD